MIEGKEERMSAPRKAPVKPLEEEEANSEKVSRIKELLAWEAPARPFKKRSKEFFSTVSAIAFLVMVILVFLKEWFLIIAIIAFSFLIYVLSTIPPQKVKHKITNRGITTNDKEYFWEELGNFWFTQQLDETILNIKMPFRYPGRLMMLLGNQKEAKVKKVLSRFLSLEKVSPTWIEKAGKWLAEKVPLEGSS
ncbi:MAG: hypothetical protein JW991_03750 [Candidatus Pacebacteria bacterium]|nr:hypothetical protein [Candidatus Paceibacterota bacterium]